ncbi:MAG: hypothetical protein FIA97_11390 [Methylococcaceae bacterium]|nr:hypothetical protein [Methylococcaceae bacterium]
MQATFRLIILSSALVMAGQAFGEDCGRHIRAGETYGNVHNGPNQQFTGEITFQNLRRCRQGVCFTASMAFENSRDIGVDKATGFWSGEHFELVRSVGGFRETQLWSGRCGPRSVSGEWLIEQVPDNRGRFSIQY